MAKKSRSNPHRNRRVVFTPNAKLRLPISDLVLNQPRHLTPSYRTDIGYDQRRFSPRSERFIARTLDGRISRVRPVSKAHKKFRVDLHRPETLTFDDVKRVAVCVRRNQRKEVLHAYNKTGRSGQRSPRRTKWSNVSC